MSSELRTHSKFVEKDSHLPNIEENVVLACIGNVRSEMLAYYTMPVGRVLLVKEALNIF